VPEAKRPDPKRRSPAGRPKGTAPARRQPRPTETRPAPEAGLKAKPDDTIRESIVASAEQQSEQRFGSAARRAAILAAVVCVLTLTIAGPVRTYFAQRTEMKQLQATEAQLRAQIADLEEQKVKLADPVFIAAQAALSYLTAGVAKARSAVWRSGRAIPLIVDTDTYGWPWVAGMLAGRPALARSACWTVIVFECLFAGALVAPEPVRLAALAVGLAFHLGCALVMGLNTFVWAFAATYPCVLAVPPLLS